MSVDPDRRDAYLAGCRGAVEQARSALGCRDFTVSADLLAPARVNVYERWDSAAELEAFRGSGPSGEQQAEVLDADVRRYEISSTGPA